MSDILLETLGSILRHTLLSWLKSVFLTWNYVWICIKNVIGWLAYLFSHLITCNADLVSPPVGLQNIPTQNELSCFARNLPCNFSINLKQIRKNTWYGRIAPKIKIPLNMGNASVQQITVYAEHFCSDGNCRLWVCLDVYHFIVYLPESSSSSSSSLLQRRTREHLDLWLWRDIHHIYRNHPNQTHRWEADF